jgi:hypothetical protein
MERKGWQCNAGIDVMMASRVPVAPNKARKTLTLPKDLIARVRDYRHARKHDQESDAYAELLELGLAKASDQEDRKAGKE